jgi:hypothetical protein
VVGIVPSGRAALPTVVRVGAEMPFRCPSGVCCGRALKDERPPEIGLSDFDCFEEGQVGDCLVGRLLPGPKSGLSDFEVLGPEPAVADLVGRFAAASG